MFARLLMALRGNGASEGKPYFGTQALGIPLVATVFLVLRILLLAKPISAVHDESFWVELSAGFGRLQFLDIALLGVCIWVYTADFFNDVLHWDARGVSMHSWQVLWVLFWGLMPFFVLFLVASFAMLFSMDNMLVLGLMALSQLKFAIAGGVGYLLLHRWGGKSFAWLGPFFIAFAFATALFWDEPTLFGLVKWWQGFMVFWLNVLLMQWFEQDKDAASESINVWLSVSSVWLKAMCALLVIGVMGVWFIADHRSWGVLVLLLLYGAMALKPGYFRFGRRYRLLIDGALVLWLL
jgi:hypothetical protein